MDLDKDKASFRLDSKARSFRPYDFGLGDVPWILIALAVVMVVLGVLNFLFAQVATFLPPQVHYIMIGFGLGFLAGLRVCDWTTRRSAPPPPPE